MRRFARTVVSVVTLLVIAGFVAVATPARANMSRPTWSSGDFWVYSLSSATVGASNASLRMDVTGTETVTVNGTPYSTYHVAATLSVQFIGTTTFPADIWFSTDTLAIVKIKAVININLGNISAGGTFEISGNPPQTIQWPLTAGATWNSQTTVWAVTTNSTGNKTYQSSPLSTDFEVQADTTVTVPAGTFTVTPLKETETLSGSYSMNYWSAPVGNWAQVSDHNSTGQGQSHFNLTSYHYGGGGFFASVIFGLPVWIWLILIVVIIAVIVGIFVMRRKPPTMQPMMPPPMPPQQPPMEPPRGP